MSKWPTRLTARAHASFLPQGYGSPSVPARGRRSARAMLHRNSKTIAKRAKKSYNNRAIHLPNVSNSMFRTSVAVLVRPTGLYPVVQIPQHHPLNQHLGCFGRRLGLALASQLLGHTWASAELSSGTRKTKEHLMHRRRLARRRLDLGQRAQAYDMGPGGNPK